MATNEDSAAMLDSLQQQLNLILEQTGRVFAAMSTAPQEKPTSQIARLKKTMPVATSRFHDALDQLECELQMASVVMRRDLAVCRERSGIQAKQDQGQDQAAAPFQPNMPPASNSTATKPAIHASEVPAANEDVIMSDWTEENRMPEQQPQPPLAEAKPSVVAHTMHTTDVTTAPKNDLQVDTKTPTVDGKANIAEEDKAPDTANDLDSLFNDPIDDGAGDANPFSFDNDGTGDIDFSSFGGNFESNGDNDNISSLLPGLEDYANTQPSAGGDLNFDNIFGVSGDGNNNPMNQQGAGEQTDTTFDDLMNMANFDGMGTDDMDEGTNNEDLDFDSLFK